MSSFKQKLNYRQVQIERLNYRKWLSSRIFGAVKEKKMKRFCSLKYYLGIESVHTSRRMYGTMKIVIA